MTALGERVHGPGTIYLTGGATALLYGWRAATIDIDIKPDPEPPGLFEAIAAIKDELDVNVELASPDQFIPAVPGWHERSLFVVSRGPVSYYHYDPYGQVLAKLQRGYDRDLRDAHAFVRDGLVNPRELRRHFDEIAPLLVRYPAIDPASFEGAVAAFCAEAAREGDP